ncbi:glycosyltransferase family 2 protein, partial [Escherichia coli]|nr:glycosyltransferase family 2 protein [Escherichia coli]
LVVLYGVGIYLTTWFNEFITTGPHGVGNVPAYLGRRSLCYWCI